MLIAGGPVTICNSASNLVTDGNFAAATTGGQVDANWNVTAATSGTNFQYTAASAGGTLPPIGPQTLTNAARYGATGTTDDTITAKATIPTVVGGKYILNFDLSLGTTTTNATDFNPSVGTALTLIYPTNYPMPCTGCPTTGGKYVFYSLSFTATSTATTLKFGGLNVPAYTYLTNIAMCTNANANTTFTS